MTEYKVNDLVGLDPDLSSRKFVGQTFKVVKVNPKTYRLQPINGGRLVNADKFLVTAPPSKTPFIEDVPLPDRFAHLPCGTLVRVSLRKEVAWLHTGDLAVVLVDKGERVNVAPLGGHEDRYARLPRQALTIVDPKSVINEKPF
jgi:hypothetical protein